MLLVWAKGAQEVGWDLHRPLKQRSTENEANSENTEGNSEGWPKAYGERWLAFCKLEGSDGMPPEIFAL